MKLCLSLACCEIVIERLIFLSFFTGGSVFLGGYSWWVFQGRCSCEFCCFTLSWLRVKNRALLVSIYLYVFFQKVSQTQQGFLLNLRTFMACFVLFLKPWYSGITFGNNRANCGSERLLLVDYDRSDGIYSRNLTANRFGQKRNGKWDSMIVFIFCTLMVNWYIYHW